LVPLTLEEKHRVADLHGTEVFPGLRAANSTEGKGATSYNFGPRSPK